ncbi:MAG: hemerythrin domain-containing protein [Rhodocyclaceae bacterium]|nr:hemerythrin domain-containing protein [Rhodocyclaceae bacterium]
MSALKPLLANHHEHCDALFAEAEQAANTAQWSDCEARFQAFVEALDAHFRAEEEVLFPAFEAATGMSGGPTAVMRGEHAQMRALVEAIQAAVSARDADEFFGSCETLVIFMEQHNRKEEGILYPMCDDRIPQAQAMADQLEQRLGATA